MPFIIIIIIILSFKIVLGQKSSSRSNGHFPNSLLFENYFVEKSS